MEWGYLSALHRRKCRCGDGQVVTVHLRDDYAVCAACERALEAAIREVQNRLVAGAQETAPGVFRLEVPRSLEISVGGRPIEVGSASLTEMRFLPGEVLFAHPEARRIEYSCQGGHCALVKPDALLDGEVLGPLVYRRERNKDAPPHVFEFYEARRTRVS